MRLRTAATGSALAALLSLNCSAPSRHKALTVFFDGVPDAQQAESAPDAPPGSQPGADTSQRVEFREHGPYAAGLCAACHDRASTNIVTAPRDELCSGCHTPETGSQYLHGPFAMGECLACHDPHMSPNRHLLVADPETACFECHDRPSVEKVTGHGDLKETCTSCHDAHGSGRRYLLKASGGD